MSKIKKKEKLKKKKNISIKHTKEGWEAYQKSKKYMAWWKEMTNGKGCRTLEIRCKKCGIRFILETDSYYLIERVSERKKCARCDSKFFGKALTKFKCDSRDVNEFKFNDDSIRDYKIPLGVPKFIQDIKDKREEKNKVKKKKGFFSSSILEDNERVLKSSKTPQEPPKNRAKEEEDTYKTSSFFSSSRTPKKRVKNIVIEKEVEESILESSSFFNTRKKKKRSK